MNRDALPPSDHEQRLADVLAEMTDRVCTGEIADLDVVCKQYPDLADDLRQLWGAVLVTDTAGAVRDEMPRQRLPTTMGDYELLEEIGRGGMGVVFRARQRSLDREVAVKMILRDRLASDADMHRFLAEASAMASLQHVGIVPVYEVGDSEGRPFFSMKLIAGETLTQKVAAGPMNVRAACMMLIAVAEAVGAAHAAGILHRDIKPSNILFAADGHPMLTDFGLAKPIGTEAAFTRSGLLVGTPAYMSPEQAGGRRQDVGVASDVYSLGSVLYFALTGRAPFVAETPMELVMLVIEQDPPPPRTLRPGLDRDLEMIVTRCLQKPADLRYADTSELIADLRAYLADERVSAQRTFQSSRCSCVSRDASRRSTGELGCAVDVAFAGAADCEFTDVANGVVRRGAA